MAKKDLLSAMPTDPAARKAIVGNVKEIVDAMIRTQAEKELIGSIKEVAEEKYSVSGAWLNAQAVMLFDKLYNEGKKIQKIREQSEQLEEFEAHFNK
jgi:rhamnogalacturonyl hydrolase YesR